MLHLNMLQKKLFATDCFVVFFSEINCRMLTSRQAVFLYKDGGWVGNHLKEEQKRGIELKEQFEHGLYREERWKW